MHVLSQFMDSGSKRKRKRIDNYRTNAHCPRPKTLLRHQTRGQLTLQVEAGLGGEAGVGAEAGGGRGAADRQRGHLGQAAQHEARHGEAAVTPHLHRGHSEESVEASARVLLRVLDPHF